MSQMGKLFLAAVVVLILAVIAFVVKGQLTNVPVVTWTMPGDPRPEGLPPVRVMGHELRLSSDSVMIFTNPVAAPAWTPMPPPLDPGLTVTVSLPGLVEGRKYFVRYRAVDSSGNWSGWSNVAIKYGPDGTGPTLVTDLR